MSSLFLKKNIYILEFDKTEKKLVKDRDIE